MCGVLAGDILVLSCVWCRRFRASPPAFIQSKLGLVLRSLSFVKIKFYHLMKKVLSCNHEAQRQLQYRQTPTLCIRYTTSPTLVTHYTTRLGFYCNKYLIMLLDYDYYKMEISL